MSEHDKSNDYNSEPVAYCAECYSLKIKYEEVIDSDCCMECGCTSIKEAPFETWEKMYEYRYGHKFAEKNNDASKSLVFNMSLSKLMMKVAECPRWDSIIRRIYSCFPRGLSKSDSIVMFFDKLVKDNKINVLKELLYKLRI